MCPDCEARRKLARDALLNAKIKEAAGHVVKGAAELVGLKKKTGVAEATAKARPMRKKAEPEPTPAPPAEPDIE